MPNLRRKLLSGPFDVAIVGSGFAGSLTALILRRLGRSVVLIERGTHPRFAIGESSSPLANLLLEQLADRYALPRIRPLASWGEWQRRYPEIGCGLKRGFTFYGHELGKPFAADPDRGDQLLVAASPHDEVADTHWYRADFDRFLVEEAQSEGAEYLDQTNLESLSWQGDTASLEGTRMGRRLAFRVRFVVDASGPSGFLHRVLGLSGATLPTLPATEGLYNHFSGVRRLDEMQIFPSTDPPPYPVDDAAVHHVFDGGWIWVLRFNNGITSAGVAATARLARELDLAAGAPAWDRLLARLPTVREQFADSRSLLPFVYRPALSFRSGTVAGPNWMLLPSAAAFVDPLLSTGFPLTLLGIEGLAAAVETSWGQTAFSARLERYATLTLLEADTAALLVSALYANFHDFPVFAALTLLYFAAASFAEAARRLLRPELSGSFLSGNHPVFGPALRRCCRMAIGLAPGDRMALFRKIREAIEPLDVAGLSDESRRNWYPVFAADLIAAAPKLGATKDQVEELLRRFGFAVGPCAAAASAAAGSI
ncbi:MAG TPA: FAD-dependent oxidoreductase [Thermoanaerobaculia bacterium]